MQILQNQGLRSAIRDNTLIDPLIQNLAELKLAQKLEGVLPQDLSLDLEQLSQKLSMLIASSQMQLPQISIPDISFAEKLPRPGLELQQQGLRPKHPVFIVPGFVTSGLDLWQTLPCAAHQQR